MKTYRAHPSGSVEDSILLAEELDLVETGRVLTLSDGYYFTKLGSSTWYRNGTRRRVHSRVVAVILRVRGGHLE